jgi:hypothetical protein
MKQIALKFIFGLLPLLLIIPHICFAQTTIQGNVLANEKQPISYASIILLRDTLFVAGTVSDSTGQFQLSENLDFGAYKLKVSAIGFKTKEEGIQIDQKNIWQSINLEADELLLKEIAVSAKRPQIIRKSDRYIVDVENSYLQTLSNSLEVLKRTPGLWVGYDGSVRLKGNQTASVMINGVLQKMSGAELTAYLETLQATDISKIEVMRNPSAEFDAEGTGGMLNIIVKKSRQHGTSGSAFMQYKQQGELPYYSVGASLDHKTPKWLFAAHYSFSEDKSKYFAQTNTTYPNQSKYDVYTKLSDYKKQPQFRASVIYDINAKHQIGIQSSGNTRQQIHPFDSDILYATNSSENITGNAHIEQQKESNRLSNTLNYTWKIDSLGAELKCIADYTRHQSDDTNQFEATYSSLLGDSTYRNHLNNLTNIYSTQIDYKKVFKKGANLKVGSKYSFISRNNDLVSENWLNNAWQLDNAASNHFCYKEKIAALYAIFGSKIKKTDISVGIRAEQTLLDGETQSASDAFTLQYTDFFPSLFVEHSLNADKGNSIYFNYLRRLNRPSFNELNPYRLKIDNYTVQIGNPNLRPQYSNSIEIGYVWHNDYFIDAYYTKNTGVIAQFVNPSSDNLITYQFRNFDESVEIGMDIGGSYDLAKWCRSSLQISTYRQTFKLNDLNNSQFVFFVKNTYDVSIDKILDLSIISEYRSPYLYANVFAAHQFFLDLSISKKLCKDKAKLTLNLSDIFNTRRDKVLTNSNNTQIDFYQKRPTRSIALHFSYNFNIGKSFNKKRIEQNNQDEKNRIN